MHAARKVTAKSASNALGSIRSRSTISATSTVASSSSIVDAKQRVREHARNISRSAAKKAEPATGRAPASRIDLPMSGPGPVPSAPLDHTFVGMSGGQIFHEMMLRHNVEHIFGYPGGAILPVFDAIYQSPHFDFILPRHEQGAGHMAEGYARITGKPGVVLVTSGPGATNVITPMQDALLDGLPLIVFTGQVATSAIGSDAFQEADIVGISRSCSKWNVMVKDITELPRRINEAFKIATSGRPGPVLVDLPKDVTAAILKTPLPFKATTPGSHLSLPQNPLHLLEPPSDLNLIKSAANLINNAQRPLLYVGNGILSSPTGKGPEILAELVEKGNIPVTTTLQGLGAFDELDPKSLHMLGMHGSAYANLAMQHADVVVALGARFDDRVTGKVSSFAPVAQQAASEGRGGIIHFEIMPKNINKVVEASIPVLGDVVTNLGHLLPMIKHSARKSWFDDINRWKKQYPFTFVPSKIPSPSSPAAKKPVEESAATSSSVLSDPPISTTASSTVEAITPQATESPSCAVSSDAGMNEELAAEVLKDSYKMKPQEVITALDKWTTENDKKGETIITTGVGQHQMWAAQFYRWTHPRTMVTSGGLGTMGFGLPAAIGAKVAAPNKTVIDIDGDASLSMTAMELATASQYSIGVKVLVLNNEFQGMVLQWQDLFYANRYSHTAMTNPDFCKLAEAMGVKAIRCHHKGELEEKMKEFLEYDGSKPILMECLVEKNEHVFPMVPAGKALHEQMLHPALTTQKK